MKFFGIVAFRFTPTGASETEIQDLNQKLVGAMHQDGYAFATSTNLRGRTVLRLCTINPRTTEEDVRTTIQRIEQLGSDFLSQIKDR